MKKLAAIILSISCCFLLTASLGAASPVVQSNSFYVNDYAVILFDEHRGEILQRSTELYEQTGVQLVVLTVKSLGEYTIDEYGNAIISGWGIGGVDGSNGVLLLEAMEEKQFKVFAGSAVSGLEDYLDAQVSFDSDNPSVAFMNVYRPVAAVLSGEEPPALQEETAEDIGSKAPSGMVLVLLAVALLAVLRTYRVSRKYKDKYLKSHIRQRKDHTRVQDREEAYQQDQERDYDGE